jgi:hypothetical protein
MKSRFLLVAAIAAQGCFSPVRLEASKTSGAQALFLATQATAAASPQQESGQVTRLTCRPSGRAFLRRAPPSDTGTDSFEFATDFADCSVPENAWFKGHLTATRAVAESQGGSLIKQKLTGLLEIKGAIDDVLALNIEQEVPLLGLQATSGAVTMRLKGRLSTLDGTQEFDEEVTVVAGAPLRTALANAEAPATRERDHR